MNSRHVSSLKGFILISNKSRSLVIAIVHKLQIQSVRYHYTRVFFMAISYVNKSSSVDCNYIILKLLMTLCVCNFDLCCKSWVFHRTEVTRLLQGS